MLFGSNLAGILLACLLPLYIALMPTLPADPAVYWTIMCCVFVSLHILVSLPTIYRLCFVPYNEQGYEMIEERENSQLLNVDGQAPNLVVPSLSGLEDGPAAVEPPQLQAHDPVAAFTQPQMYHVPNPDAPNPPPSGPSPPVFVPEAVAPSDVMIAQQAALWEQIKARNSQQMASTSLRSVQDAEYDRMAAEYQADQQLMAHAAEHGTGLESPGSTTSGLDSTLNSPSHATIGTDWPELPPLKAEPDQSSSTGILRFRLPDGSQVKRRFDKDEVLEGVKQFVDHELFSKGLSRLLTENAYRLVTRPPRTVHSEMTQTLEAAQLVTASRTGRESVSQVIYIEEVVT